MWFFIAGNWDVYSNIGCTTPCWKLGNLKTDPLRVIFDNFESDRIPPLRLNNVEGLLMLARRYGDPNSQLVVNGMEQHWCERCCLLRSE